jgi:signal transduction histidine kinase
VEKALLVRSHPIKIDHEKFVLLFLQDITRQQQRAALERTFFHDINNLVGMLIGASEMLVEEEPSELAQTVHHASLRIIKEVAIQQSLLNSDSFPFQPVWHDYTSTQIIHELKSFFANHPAASGKNVHFSELDPAITVRTDLSLLSRVLCNMIINALEATDRNGIVRVGTKADNSRLSFNVWNAREIAPEISKRIFQRNFSTKAQAGRGIGTFSMKLFGEKYLGGLVNFESSETHGTVFSIALPL